MDGASHRILKTASSKNFGASRAERRSAPGDHRPTPCQSRRPWCQQAQSWKRLAYGHDKGDGDHEDDTDWTQTTGDRIGTARSHLWRHWVSGLKYGAVDGRKAWIGVIPRGSTVLITEGHISLTAVSVFEVGFPSTTCIADGRRHQGVDMGTVSRGGCALGHPRDDKSASYIWMYMVSGHKDWRLLLGVTHFTLRGQLTESSMWQHKEDS